MAQRRAPVPLTRTAREDGVVVTPERIEAVRRRIAERAHRYVPDGPIEGADCCIRPLGEPSSYPVLAADVTDASGAVRLRAVVKFAPVFPENNEGRTEYEHLVRMHRRLGGNGPLRVARPLDFYEDLDALVTERVGGERFNRVLLRDATRGAGAQTRERLARIARRCGQWLREWHAETAAGEVSAFGEAWRAHLDDVLERLSAVGFPREARAAVESAARVLERWNVAAPLARRHGDYGPQNVHADDDAVWVFDLNYPDDAPVYVDVTYFLVTLQTMAPRGAGALRFSRAVLRALETPFLEGYFGRAPNATERALVAAWRVPALAARCLKQRRNTAARGAVAAWAFDRWQVRRVYPRRIRDACGAALRSAREAGGGA